MLYVLVECDEVGYAKRSPIKRDSLNGLQSLKSTARQQQADQQVYFSNSQHNFKHSQASYNGNTQPNLLDPINPPLTSHSEHSRQLESALRESLEENAGDAPPPLNLAGINARSALTRSRMESANLREKESKDLSQRVVFGNMAESRHDSPLVLRDIERMDKLDSKKLGMKHPGPWKLSGPMTGLANYKQGLIDKWTQNCITRSTPLTQRCEDHLIRRLDQDAREGRTVVDVGRRVCCAIFWHKDCINRVVLETCPDSSPMAADFLIGSRKLDLTLSCQRFNRDGCNSSLRMVDVNLGVATFTLISVYVLMFVLYDDLERRFV